MPYKINKIAGGYQVKNLESGRILAKKTTKSKAEAQIRLLNLIDKRRV